MNHLTEALQDRRGLRKYRATVWAIVALTVLALFGKLDTIAAGAIVGALGAFCVANLKSKASAGSPTP
jgi:hypothetical protein